MATFKQATFVSGTSLSPAVSLGHNEVLSAVEMPASWTSANLTFQASEDGATFNDVYDGSGNELTITAAQARWIFLDMEKTRSLKHFKIRSGTSGSAVAQGGNRTLNLYTNWRT